MLLLSHCFLHSSSHWLETYEQCNQTYTKLHDIKVHSNNTVFLIFPLKSILLKAFPTRVRWKNSAQCCFIYNTNEKTQSHRSCDVQQESAFTSPGPGDNRRSKSFFITVTPLFCSTTSAICSSPAAYQNCRALSGIYRWFATVVCLNILSRTPLTSFTLKSLPFSDKSMGQPGSAGNFTLTHDTRVSAARCRMMHYA